MLQAERLDIIKKYIDDIGYVDITSLVNVLGMSKSTVRRDLKRLQEGNAIEITWGGAISTINSGSLREDSYKVKVENNRDEKRRMAEFACKMLTDRQSVFLDSGTTIKEMVPIINRKPLELLVATNDIAIACGLNETDNIVVTVIGGTLRKGYYTLTGVFSETILREICLDTAFMSCDSIDLINGFSLTNMEEVPIKRMIMSAASKTVMLCDHSKFNKKSFMQLFDITPSVEIITGKELDDETYNRYIEKNLNIIRV